MARPTLPDVLSGANGWDTSVNDNKNAIVNAPFPIYEAATVSALVSGYPAANYSNCFAVVAADGLIYRSNGTSWAVYRQAANVVALTDNTGGTSSDTLAALATSVTGVDGTGSNAASKADVDTALGILANSISSLATKLNAEISAIKTANLQATS